jgi:hypothetical protein
MEKVDIPSTTHYSLLRTFRKKLCISSLETQSVGAEKSKPQKPSRLLRGQDGFWVLCGMALPRHRTISDKVY